MADVIFTSIKKILQDANLPLTLKFDNDKSTVNTYKAKLLSDYPQGSNQIELINFYTEAPFENNIIGMKFSDIKNNIYTITDYTNSTVTLDTSLVIDILIDDSIILNGELNENTLLVTFYSSSIPQDRSIRSKLRRVIKSFDLELAIYNDIDGEISNNIITKVCKIFSNQFYLCYDENGIKTGESFNLELEPTFSRKDTTDLSRSYIGRVRFWKYENYNDI